MYNVDRRLIFNVGGQYMEIQVKLFANFRDGRWKNKNLSFNNTVDIRYILEKLEIDEKDLGIALINGAYSEVNCELKDNDVLALFPPIGGG